MGNMELITSRGVGEILRERDRQYEVHGYTDEHDDQHFDSSMVYAAAVLALPEVERNFKPPDLGVSYVQVFWPKDWNKDIIRPEENVEDRIRNLAKAGALIAAEIDRLWRNHGQVYNADRQGHSSNRQSERDEPGASSEVVDPEF